MTMVAVRVASMVRRRAATMVNQKVVQRAQRWAEPRVFWKAEQMALQRAES